MCSYVDLLCHLVWVDQTCHTYHYTSQSIYKYLKVHIMCQTSKTYGNDEEMSHGQRYASCLNNRHQFYEGQLMLSWSCCVTFTFFPLGDITISGGVTLTVDSDLNETSPQFTLTCISTGGPATTVTWTRNSNTVTEGTETVLDDRVTAQYTHTLTVTGRLGGLYTCTVANDKPSEVSAEFNVPINGTQCVYIFAVDIIKECVELVVISLNCCHFLDTGGDSGGGNGNGDGDGGDSRNGDRERGGVNGGAVAAGVVIPFILIAVAVPAVVVIIIWWRRYDIWLSCTQFSVNVHIHCFFKYCPFFHPRRRSKDSSSKYIRSSPTIHPPPHHSPPASPERPPPPAVQPYKRQQRPQNNPTPGPMASKKGMEERNMQGCNDDIVA